MHEDGVSVRPSEDMEEHIFLVAIDIMAPSREDARAVLPNYLPDIEPDENEHVECWWIAEDDRIDGSDNDSAVFVRPGSQRVAAQLLLAAGLTAECNLVDRTDGQFWAEDDLSNPSLQEVKENLLEWLAAPAKEV